MSVIGEAVAGVAVAASFTQLLAHILSTTRTLKGFYENMQNAPSELSHVVQKLNLVYDNLKVLESILLKSATFDEIAPNLQSLLRDTMGVVDRAVYDMKNQCLVKSMNAIKSRGSRFRYAWSGHDDVTKHLQRLRDAETSLSHTCQLLTMYISFAVHTELQLPDTRRQSEYTHEGIPAEPKKSELAATRNSNIGQQFAEQQVNVRTRKIIGHGKSYSLHRNSWLRKFGIYYALDQSITSRNTRITSVCLRMDSPSFLIPKSLALRLRFLHSTSSANNISILPGYIQVQNRIPITSPFMLACQMGNTSLIRQYLDQDRELLHSRTMCAGRTPLMLAISSNNLDAVECLLRAGANPNMGDDEQILPAFQALGFVGRCTFDMQSCPIMQWPPENLHWLEMLELLVKHGASVHELNGGKTITALNLTNEDYEPDILIRFFNLLLGQNYIDFDVLDFQKPSALLNAIRSGQNALQAIDTLSAAGVDLKRVAPDGRSALHLAAEMSMDEAPLKHLQQKYGLEEVNRKDQWGWTPLHYAIFSASNQTRKCRKVRYLLEQGADPYIDSSVPFAVVSKFFHPTHHGGRGFTPFQWAVEFGADVFERFVDDMRATGPRLYEEQGECDDDDDNGGDQFYDAREGC